MSTFPTAPEARAGSRNNTVIHAEIRAIEEAIYAAIEEGLLNVDVGTGTTDSNNVQHGYVSPMTDPLTYDPMNPDKVDARDYYATLFTDVDNRSLREQVEIVQANFVNLGYAMTYLKNTSTGNTFFWRILW